MKIISFFNVYLTRVRAFHPNARLYLCNAVLHGAAFGVYRLLANFYILSLGFDEKILGQLITTSHMAALLVALPMGYVADRLGRKNSLLIGEFGTIIAIAIMLIHPSRAFFFSMHFCMGAAQSLTAVTMAPFLLENSGRQERTWLFSLSAGLQMAAVFAGNSIGGFLPGWIGTWRHCAPTSSQAYAGALAIIIIAALLAMIPLLKLSTPRVHTLRQNIFSPFTYARKHPATLGKLISPIFVTAIGAGLFMPFLNVFFRVAHHQSDPVIGTVLAWGALAMGCGILIAPPLAEKTGTARLVIISQALSIPFLLVMGFTPYFWMVAAAHYARLTLMNMAGPLFQTYVMEHVEVDARATVSSLVNMAGTFGWAFSPFISGWVQVNYGFRPVFAGVVVLYCVAVCMYWKFFWNAMPVKKHLVNDLLPIENE